MLTRVLHSALMTSQGVYFNAHRSRDGCWVAAEQLERTPQGRLKAYVALHGHGTYPTVSRLSTAQSHGAPASHAARYHAADQG